MKQNFIKYKVIFGFAFFSIFALPNTIKAQSFTDAVIDSVIGLPVNFINFTGVREDKNVTLKWTTGNEVDNSHFNIQRSVDGINFETIGKQNPLAAKQYWFTDINATQSILYYKIENVDRDGKKNYSNTITIKYSILKAEDWNIYPNPIVNNIINIETKGLLNGQYKVSINSVKGETIFVKNIIINAANNLATIQLPQGFAKGMYVLNMASADGKINSSKKVIIQ